MADSTTSVGSGGRRLPSTSWPELLALSNATTSSYVADVNLLIQKYWKPVYCYFCRCGIPREEAKDLTQRFFIERDVFRQADPARGRFRALLYASLDNFRRNAHREANAQRRRPPAGIISIEDLLPAVENAFELPAVNVTSPEDSFFSDWIASLVHRVLAVFERECLQTGKQEHYILINERIVRPSLEGGACPSMDDLADDLGLTPKQACNRLLTARRAFQRLLREEICSYAASDDEVAAELRAVFHYFSGST